MYSPIGQYLNKDSFVHRLDPRVKLSLNIIFIVLTFVTPYFITLGIILIPLIVGYILATNKYFSYLKLLKMPIIVSIVLLFINVYTMKNTDTTNYHIWFKITPDGTYAMSTEVMLRTLGLLVRIYIMILATSLFVMTTKPILLTKAIEDLIFPLKLLFIPTHIIAMIISIALRFIPTLLDEGQRIMKAQSSRGIDFKNGKFKEKTKSFTTLIIPLFVTSFAKAEDLSNAMETRGYDPHAKRTRYRKLRFSWRDFLVIGLIIALIVFIALNIHLNYLPSWYTITRLP